MPANKAQTRTVAIIGGGVSGTLTALHLRETSKHVQVVIIEPRPEPGLGLAYSTPSLRHLLNVPAGKISALPSDPEHFLTWLRANFDPEATAMTFAPRAVFGRYIRSLLAQTDGIAHQQATVADLHLEANSALLTFPDGSSLHADYVVLATGNFDPAALPGIDMAASASGAYCHNAWAPPTYANLPPEAPVTLIGTGLTAVDVLLRLRELGHKGVITAVSRHGVFPSHHGAYTPAAYSAIAADTPATSVNYLRALRAAIAGGMEWRAAIDSLRGTTNDLWLALPLREQQRFRRHLQRRWDVVRHRMAPAIADCIDAELAAGTLQVGEGQVENVSAIPGGAKVVLHKAGEQRELFAARVINCTGPSMNYRRVGSSLLSSLFAQGLVTAGPTGGGVNTTRLGALIDLQGQASNILFNLGPGRLGTLLESIAIPEIREQAAEIAGIIAGNLAARVNDSAATTAAMSPLEAQGASPGAA